jgi:lipid-binding SYLF domain-containing protein
MNVPFKSQRLAALIISLFLFSISALASTEEERVKDAGEVIKEILNIPDDIPQDLLDKAECLVILPSVKKGAGVMAAE